jgi:hypothetical protein
LTGPENAAHQQFLFYLLQWPFLTNDSVNRHKGHESSITLHFLANIDSPFDRWHEFHELNPNTKSNLIFPGRHAGANESVLDFHEDALARLNRDRRPSREARHRDRVVGSVGDNGSALSFLDGQDIL